MRARDEIFRKTLGRGGGWHPSPSCVSEGGINLNLSILFTINITHLYCQKLNKKENFKKGNSQPHKNQENRFVTSLKGHLIISFLRKFAFLRPKKKKIKTIRFLATIKGFCNRKSSYFAKKVKITALFTNMRTLKFVSRLHNCVFSKFACL